MCYGDIAYGKDGYYQQWAEEQQHREHQEEQERQMAEEQYLKDYGSF